MPESPDRKTARRTVAKGAIWAGPPVLLGISAPALAVSALTCPTTTNVRTNDTPGNWSVANPSGASANVQISYFVGGLVLTGAKPTGVASWSICPTVITATTNAPRTITAGSWTCNPTQVSWGNPASPSLFFTLPGYTVTQNIGGERVSSFNITYFIQYYDINGTPLGTNQGTGCSYGTGNIAANQTSAPSTTTSWTPGLFAPHV